jgi:hypothetical protein
MTPSSLTLAPPGTANGTLWIEAGVGGRLFIDDISVTAAR